MFTSIPHVCVMPQFFKDPLFCCEARNMNIQITALTAKASTLLEQMPSRLGLLLLQNPVTLNICGARIPCSGQEKRVMRCLWEFLCRILPSSGNAVQGLREESIRKLLAGEIMNPGGTRQFVLLDAFSQSMLQSSKNKAKSPWMAPHLHRVISSTSSTKIQSVVILRKITSWFGDKEGRDLHNKICCSVGCCLWISLLFNWAGRPVKAPLGWQKRK